ncbi:phosphoribosylamine--glycine ligase [Amphibacillus sp. Q70]|uniref:phosphoribosylamine--glycine ligase n=1 Tax=Amphibacillus sp. Q70 TaxID=3453416 RepID=UPI003F8497FB
MKVLVIGCGGREHMLVKKLNQSARVTEVFVAPGNAGIRAEATCINIAIDAIDELLRFAKKEAIEWTIVGPEIPLANGIVDQFRAADLNIFGPTKAAALIESSKDFSKTLMKKYHIPTARFQTFTDSNQAKLYIKEQGAPIVVKADGLAEGKGVVVAMTEQEACEAVEQMLESNCFGAAGAQVVIEEFLIGEEFSLFAFVEGEAVYPMIPARDYKRAFDGDQGPNTGGMGAYSSVPDVSEADLEFTTETILKPVARAMVAEGRPYTGVLYAGLIQTVSGIKVIEFNARFGDPETQVVLPLLENDLIDVIEAVNAGVDPKLTWRDGYAVGVVVASSGYPKVCQKGVVLPKLPETIDGYLIQAGTTFDDQQHLVSNGGRIFLVGSVQKTLAEASEEVYRYLRNIDQMDNFYYRTDIGVI